MDSFSVTAAVNDGSSDWDFSVTDSEVVSFSVTAAVNDGSSD